MPPLLPGMARSPVLRSLLLGTLVLVLGIPTPAGAQAPATERAEQVEQLWAFVDRGGFLLAMCTATETLDLALASAKVDIAASYADGSPMDPDAGRKMDWSRALAFQGAQLQLSPNVPAFSDIASHQVNSRDRRQQLGAFKLVNFSAKIDPGPTMLVHCHREVIPDF